MTDERLFLQEVKRYVQEIDPQAEVWLFGSRARGDARADSDWDFLVLTDKLVDRQFKYHMSDHLFGLELASGQVISMLVHQKKDWQDLEATDLYQNVKDDSWQV